MINILFFARIREQLGTGSWQVVWDDNVDNVDRLIQSLVAAKGTKWSEALQADNVVVAVNQQVANRQTSLVAGDEVAFFPPVTGG